MSDGICALHGHDCPLGGRFVCTYRSHCILNWLQYPTDKRDWARIQRFLSILAEDGSAKRTLREESYGL